jgi:ParB family chromosome partitioning protein
MKKMALGRGLSALIPTAPEERAGKNFIMLNLDEIVPNVNQPRKYFEEEKLAQLRIDGTAGNLAANHRAEGQRQV